MEKNSWFKSCLLPASMVILLVIAGGVWLYIQRPNTVSGLIPASPVIVDIVTPDSGESAVSGEGFPVLAKAFSPQSLSSLVLSVDGLPFGEESVSGNSADGSWVWVASSPGVHMLVVRATDEQGNIGQSQVIVNVDPAGSSYTAQGLESQADVAYKLGIDPYDLAANNPALPGTGPIGAGTPVNLPHGGGAGDYPAPPQGLGEDPAPAPNPIIFWFNSFTNNPEIPNAPDIAASTDNCTIQLYITPHDNQASGFKIYRWTIGETDFSQIATLGAGQSGTPIHFEDNIPPAVGMKYLYYANAFNSAGETPSNITGLPDSAYTCDPGPNTQVTQINWEINFKEAVDQSYCYESNQEGVWKRMPAADFEFFPGQATGSQALILTSNEDQTTIILECWGWKDGVLKFLGKGEANLDRTANFNPVVIHGPGWDASGVPEFKPLGGSPPPGGENLAITPPFALREAESAAECGSHYGGSIWAAVICDSLMNAQVKQYYMLVWEWKPNNDVCWPGATCTDYINDIEGYKIYEIDQGQYKFLKTIPNPEQHTAAVLLPWGGRCYVVHAYADVFGVGEINSQFSNVYCPGEDTIAPDTITLKPTDWLTTDGIWVELDCDTYGTAPHFSPTGTQIVTGVFGVNNDDCFREGDASAGVLFDLPSFDPSAVIHKATLHFDQIGRDYHIASYVATNQQPLCTTRVGTAKQDWTNLSPGHFIHGKNTLWGNTFYQPYSKAGFSTDVTSVVLNWMKKPANNHGFILITSSSDLINSNFLKSNSDNWVCYSLLDNIELTIDFFKPGN